MKHLITTLIVAVTLSSGAVLLASSPGYGEKQFDDCQKSGRHMGKGAKHSSEHRFIERMTKKLNLSQEQNTAVLAIVEQSRPQMQQFRDKMRDNRQQLQKLMEQDTLDETAVRQLAEQQGSYKAELIVLRSKMRSEISKQLNETQREQLKQMRERRKHKPF